MNLTRRGLFSVAVSFAAIPSFAAAPFKIVAAENMYGDIARQIAGPQADISSILNNPNDEPHLFAASPSVARNLAGADIVIINGADYDPWMDQLLSANAAPARIVVSVAKLLGRKPGDNPHLWYDPTAVPDLTKALIAALTDKDPANAATYQANGEKLLTSLTPIHTRIAQMRAKYAGIKVTATEPVFGLMAQALGLNVLNERFQLAVMNDTEPAPADVAKFEDDLKNHRAQMLIYNSQVTDNLTTTIKQIATQAGVPIIGVTETEPPGLTYQAWMNTGLDSVDQALSHS